MTFVFSGRFVVNSPIPFECQIRMDQTNAKTTVTLEIVALSYGPYGIGRVDGKAVMIPHTAPGDRIEARIVESKDRYAIGAARRIIEPSPLRQTPPCPYAGTCGGCSWQHLRYDAQLEAKQKSVDDALRRIGKLDGFELRPIIPSADEYHYRRRIHLQVGADNRLGFYAASSHELVEIEACLIADERLNKVIELVRRWARGLNTTIEHVEIVTGDEPKQLVVVVEAIRAFVPRDESGCANLVGMGGEIQGLIVAGSDWRKVWGVPRITVKLHGDHSPIVDADSFTQVNPEGNRRILDELLSAGGFQKSDRALELYCGAGNFTLPMARQSKEVVAVDGYRPAIANGKLNAQRDGVDNIRWISAPVPRALAELKRRREKFTKIVLDPPRTGAKGIETELAALGAAKILYVSCNPATLARDLAALVKHGYKLRRVQPIDLFPQTFHVEALAILER
jgi:23S rRNA (uracil1939-C5)-methyltransferase